MHYNIEHCEAVHSDTVQILTMCIVRLRTAMLQKLYKNCTDISMGHVMILIKLFEFLSSLHQFWIIKSNEFDLNFFKSRTNILKSYEKKFAHFLKGRNDATGVGNGKHNHDFFEWNRNHKINHSNATPSKISPWASIACRCAKVGCFGSKCNSEIFETIKKIIF